tara:strand:+ start:161 stop:442 length:282 start_codon:yes stop_codon:yes gene_type:complete
MTTINYQKIYEDEVSSTIKESLEMPRGFYELSHHMRMLVEEVADHAARQTTEAVLDPEILRETAELAADMGTQLYQFANMIKGQVGDVAPLDD